MRRLLLIGSIIALMLTPACVNDERTLDSSEPEPAIDESIIPTNRSEYCLTEDMSLDSETKKFIYGTWVIEKLLGFANSYNDASEYPVGQKIIGEEIVIQEDFFSTIYGYQLKNPVYQITATCYNSDSFYRYYKMDVPDLKLNDEVKAIDVDTPSGKNILVSVSFLVVNNERLILSSEATIFELKKISD
ncbi:hypothetical protein [Paenibacillus xylaniclasticus]|uniref:hypothetical protein n=1 Tax=Paenibacillus xylaniclasticus TaxID=588083 RepID=UPI000FD7330B|nr:MULTISPECIES: hypothetical protein [Paenibacillus]GFN31366.1 hypothetical protein PCURB6_16260 [Paenibacillus curdlanolyticus]